MPFAMCSVKLLADLLAINVQILNALYKLGMLNSNFFQNRNSVPKNRVKIETRILPVQCL